MIFINKQKIRKIFRIKKKVLLNKYKKKKIYNLLN